MEEQNCHKNKEIKEELIMKLNKKGFTLIELLAVIVLLLAISAMAISSISAAIERNKDKQNQTKQRVLESYAEVYYQQNKNRISANNKKCVTVKELYDSGIITEKEATDANGKQFKGGIYFNNGTKFEYKAIVGGC